MAIQNSPEHRSFPANQLILLIPFIQYILQQIQSVSLCVWHIYVRFKIISFSTFGKPLSHKFLDRYIFHKPLPKINWIFQFLMIFFYMLSFINKINHLLLFSSRKGRSRLVGKAIPTILRFLPRWAKCCVKWYRYTCTKLFCTTCHTLHVCSLSFHISQSNWGHKPRTHTHTPTNTTEAA